MKMGYRLPIAPTISAATTPFVNPPNIKEKIQWVQPKLVCEIEYAELTADDLLRQTTFLGWRDDKKPKRGCARDGNRRLSDVMTHL
jgi:ATP-dependent DNA ligase